MGRRAAAPRAPAPVAAPPGRSRARWIRAFLVPAAAILALAFLAHGPALKATWVWDDNVYVTENPHLGDAAGLFDMWFRLGATKEYVPLVFTTFWLEHRIWGLVPRGFHAVNLAFHALDALLLWALLRRLRVRGAWLAAATFATHPVFVQSVAWVSQLKNVQSAFFALLCLHSYFRFDPPEGPRRPGEGRDWSFYAFSLALFAAALASKPTVVSLPLVILLVVFWKRAAVARNDLLAVAPMLAMSLAAGLAAIHVEQPNVAAGPAWQLTLLERLLVSARSLWFYAGKLAWPSPLTSNYPRWTVDVRDALQWIPAVAAAAVLAGLWLGRGRVGRGPLAAVAAFVVLVAPLTGLFNVAHHLYSFVADHFQYHAAPALLALAAAGVASLRGRLPGKGAVAGLDAATGVLLLGLALLSRQHARAFLSEEARCRDVLAKNPRAWVAMNNLGVALNAKGKSEEAVRWFREALRVRPVYPEAHSNLGVALVALGDFRGAIREHEAALATWPAYANGRNNLGTALAAAGDLPAAIREYREAVRIDPGHAQAHNNLAKLLARSGDIEGAIRHHREALRIRPEWAEAHRDLGTTLAAAGRPQEANAEFEVALRLEPNDAATLNGLGMALAAAGRNAEAISRFEDALRVDPAHAGAHNNLGSALASRGDLDGAIGHFEEAVRLGPGDAEARRNLGTAMLSRGDVAGAETQLREAARLDPRDARALDLLGVALARTGKLDEAVRAFESAVAADPSDASPRRNLEEARRLRRQAPASTRRPSVRSAPS